MSKNSTDTADGMERRKKERRTKKTINTDVPRMILLDTNVFMDFGAQAVLQYHKDNIVIAHVVREELNSFKKDNRRIGENVRQTTSLFDTLIDKTCGEKGISLSFISHLLSIKTNASGFLFFQKEETENNPMFFSEEVTDGKIISVTIKLKNGEEKTISLPDDIGRRVKKSLRNNDQEILSIAINLKEKGENVVLVTNDKYLRTEANLQGIATMKHTQELNLSRKNAGNRRGRIASQHHNPHWGIEK